MKSKKRSSYAKGNIYENEVKKILQSDGYIVFKQHRKPVYIEGRMFMLGADIFGCDIVAKKEDEPTLWVQVSTEDNLHKKIKQVKEFPWNLRGERLEIWCKIRGRKAYRVHAAPTFKESKVKEVARGKNTHV